MSKVSKLQTKVWGTLELLIELDRIMFEMKSKDSTRDSYMVALVADVNKRYKKLLRKSL
jgi:hypothetical protein